MLNLDTHILLGALAGELSGRAGELLARESWSVDARDLSRDPDARLPG